MAERLTEHGDHPCVHCEGIGSCRIDCDNKKIYEKLQYYEDLEEHGRLIELPCAVGDTVYEVQKIRKRIQEYTVTYVNYNNHSLYYGWRVKDGKGIYSNLNGFGEHEIGKTVFMTREEAEAALKERESE